MIRAFLGTIFTCLAVSMAFGQSAEAPLKFDAADIRTAAKSQFPFMRTLPVRGGRYEIKSATMVDLIHLAYNFDDDKILGGPSWLEMNRYDVTAKVPPSSTADAEKLMLQALLADRFKLVLHKDTKPLPTHVLVAGKKPQLKEAAGTEESGCKPAQSGGGGEGTMRIMMAGSVAGRGDSAPVTFTLAPGGIIQYECRNMTMEAFAGGLRTMLGAQVGPNAVLDETGLKGKWNFDVRWSMGMFPVMGGASQADHITVSEAVEKQLGLKLEERQIPTPVMVVDSVNEAPGANPPGTSDLLPMIPPPTEFEVASVKPADPGGRGFRTQMQAGGRVNFQGVPMRLLIMQAFAVNNNDQISGIPAWADSERFDIMAKAPSDDPSSPSLDRDTAAPLLRSLLADRFKMTYHTEDRQVSAYTLTAAKPKMKKADPASRTFCKNLPTPPGTPAGTRVFNCQNVTMAQFAERLQGMTQELNWPVADATGIDGGWDLTLTFSMNFGMNFAMRTGGGDALPSAAGGPASPSDPTGGLSLFEAMEKQLGLKLEKQKRSGAVFVIDHLEQKPTEN